MKRPFYALVGLVVACADPIGTFDDHDMGTPDQAVDAGGQTVPAVSGMFTHSEVDGEIASSVDATEVEARQYLDLDSGQSTDDPARWDIAFRRFFVYVNGGISGNGGVTVAYADAALGDASAATTEYTSAVEDTEDDPDSEPNSPFNNGLDDWFDYDVDTHSLSAKVRTYFVTTTTGGEAKLQLLDYYDEAGTPARITFRWELIREGMDVPDLPDAGVDSGTPDMGVDMGPTIPDDAVTVDASLRSTWTYWAVDGSSLRQVEIDDPTTSMEWDLTLRRTGVGASPLSRTAPSSRRALARAPTTATPCSGLGTTTMRIRGS